MKDFFASYPLSEVQMNEIYSMFKWKKVLKQEVKEQERNRQEPTRVDTYCDLKTTGEKLWEHREVPRMFKSLNTVSTFRFIIESKEVGDEERKEETN